MKKRGVRGETSGGDENWRRKTRRKSGLTINKSSRREAHSKENEGRIGREPARKNSFRNSGRGDKGVGDERT